MFKFFQFLMIPSIIYSFSISLKAMGPGEGAGGDSVYCTKEEGTAFTKNGYYSLDYALTVKDQEPLSNFELNSYFTKLEKILDKLPNLGDRFKLYNDQRSNTTYWDAKHRYVWTLAKASLPNLADENATRYLPDNCKSKSSKNLPYFQVTIRKVISSDVVNFETDEAKLKQLQDNSPLQESYHYLHEFLRDFTQDSEVIRRVNSLLHSSVLENMTEFELAENLLNLGLGQFEIKSDIQTTDFIIKKYVHRIPPSTESVRTTMTNLITEYAKIVFDKSQLPTTSEQKFIWTDCIFTNYQGVDLEKSNNSELHLVKNNEQFNFKYIFRLKQHLNQLVYNNHRMSIVNETDELRLLDNGLEEVEYSSPGTFHYTGDSLYRQPILEGHAEYETKQNIRTSVRINRVGEIIGITQINTGSSMEQWNIKDVFKCSHKK